MASMEDDYLLRLIRQLAVFVRRCLNLKGEGRLVEAQQALDDAWMQLLGLPRHVAATVDVASLARILGTAERAQVAADLLDLEAALLGADHAAALRSRAEKLRVR